MKNRESLSLVFGIFLVVLSLVVSETSSTTFDPSLYPPNIIPFEEVQNTWIPISSCRERWFSLNLTEFVSPKPFTFSVALSAMYGKYKFFVTEYMPQLNDALNPEGVNINLEPNWSTSLYETCQVPGYAESTSLTLDTTQNSGILQTTQFGVFCNVKKITYYIIVENIGPSNNESIYLSVNYLYLPIPIEIPLNSTINEANVVSQIQFTSQLTNLWMWSFFYFDIPTIIAQRPGSTISITIVNQVSSSLNLPNVEIHLNRISPAIPYSSACDLDFEYNSYQLPSCLVVKGGRIYFTTVNTSPTVLTEYTVQVQYARAPLLDLSITSKDDPPVIQQRVSNVGSMSLSNQVDYYVIGNTNRLSLSDTLGLQLFVVVDNVINGEVTATVVPNATVDTIPFSCNTPRCTTGNGGCQFFYDACAMQYTDYMVGVKVASTLVSTQPLYYTVSAVLLPIPMYNLALSQGYVETVGAVEPFHTLRYSFNHGLTGSPGDSLSIYLYINQNSRGSVYLDISSTPDVGRGCVYTSNSSHSCNLYSSSQPYCTIQLQPCDLKTYGPTIYIAVTGQPYSQIPSYYWHDDVTLFTLRVQTRVPQVLEVNEIYDHSVKQGQWAWYSISSFTGTLFLEVIEPLENYLLTATLYRIPPGYDDDVNSPGCTSYEIIPSTYTKKTVYPVPTTSSKGNVIRCPACLTYSYYLVIKASTNTFDNLDVEYTITTGSITTPLYNYSSNFINYEAQQLSVTGESGIQLNDQQLNYTYILDISTDQVDAGNKVLQVSFNIPECSYGQQVTVLSYYIPRNVSERAECLMDFTQTRLIEVSRDMCSGIALSLSPCALLSNYVSTQTDILVQVFFNPGTNVINTNHQLASIIYTLVDPTNSQAVTLSENDVVSIDVTPSQTIFSIQLDAASITPPSNNAVYIEIKAPVGYSTAYVLTASVYQVPDNWELECGLPSFGLMYSTSSYSPATNAGYLVFPFRACELYYRWSITNGYTLMIQTVFTQISPSTVASISWKYVDESVPSVLSGLTFQDGVIEPISDNLQPHLYKYFSLTIGAEDIEKSLIVYVYSDVLINHGISELTLLVNSPLVGNGVLPNVDCGCFEWSYVFNDHVWFVLDPCQLMVGTYTFGIVWGANSSVIQEKSLFKSQYFPTVLPKYSATATLDDLYIPLDIDFPTNYLAAPGQTMIFYFTLNKLLGTDSSHSKVLYFMGATQLLSSSSYITFRLTANKDPCACPTPPPFPDYTCPPGSNCIIPLPYCENYNGTVYVVATAPSSPQLQIPFTTQLVTTTTQATYSITPSSTCGQEDYQYYTIDSLFKIIFFDLGSSQQISVNIQSLQNGLLDIFTSSDSTPPLSQCSTSNSICSSDNPSIPINCTFSLNCVQQFSIGINSLTSKVFSQFQPVTFTMKVCDLSTSPPVPLPVGTSSTAIPLLYPGYKANYTLSLSSITFTPDTVVILQANIIGAVSIQFVQKYSVCDSETGCSDSSLPSLNFDCGGSNTIMDTCVYTVTQCMLPALVNTTVPWFIQVTNSPSSVFNASGTLTVTTQQLESNLLTLTVNKPLTLTLKPYEMQLVTLQISDTDVPSNVGLFTATLDFTLNTFQPAKTNNRTASAVNPIFVVGNNNLPLPVPSIDTSYLIGNGISLYPTCQSWTLYDLSNPGFTTSFSPYSSPIVCAYANCNSAVPVTVNGLLINMDKYNTLNITLKGTVTQTFKYYTLEVPGTNTFINGSVSDPAVITMTVPPLNRGQVFKLTVDIQSPVASNLHYATYTSAILIADNCLPSFPSSIFSPTPGLSNQLLYWDSCSVSDGTVSGYKLSVVLYTDDPSNSFRVRSTIIDPLLLSVGGSTLTGTVSEQANIVVFLLNPSSIPTDPTAKIVLNYGNTINSNWAIGFADNLNTYPSLPFIDPYYYLSCAISNSAAASPSGSPFSPLKPCSNGGIQRDYFVTFLAIQTNNVPANISYHINATVYVDPMPHRSFPTTSTVNITSGQIYYLDPPSNSENYYSILMESNDGLPFNISSNSGCLTLPWQIVNEGTCSGRCVFPVLECNFNGGRLYYQIGWTGSNNRLFNLSYTVNTISPISLEPNFVKGGSLSSGEVLIFHLNSSTSSYNSPNYWASTSSFSFNLFADAVTCGGNLILYESWLTPSTPGCPSNFNTNQINLANSPTSIRTETVYLNNIDYWLVFVPLWDLDVNHAPLTFYIEVVVSPAPVYVTIHENERHQINMTLVPLPTDPSPCFLDMQNNSISCSDGCNPPNQNTLSTFVSPVVYIYEYLQAGPALEDRTMTFSVPSYIGAVTFFVLIDEGHASYSTFCTAGNTGQCSVLIPTCNGATPRFEFEIEVTVQITGLNNIPNSVLENLYLLYGDSVPLAYMWIDRLPAPVTTIKGSTSMVQFYIDVVLSNQAKQFFVVLPPDNYQTFVGYVFEITNVSMLATLSVGEIKNGDICSSTPTYHCGCDPTQLSTCSPNAVACQNSPPTVCDDTNKYPKVNKLGSCSNQGNNSFQICQPWVVSNIPQLCNFCSGSNTFYISATSSNSDKLVTFRLYASLLPTVPNPPTPPSDCVKVPPYSQFPQPYWPVQPYFYTPSLTTSGPDEYYLIKFTSTQPKYYLAIIEYPIQFNGTNPTVISTTSFCTGGTGGDSLIDDSFNSCNLIYQSTGSSPLIMVLLYNTYLTSSSYFYINESKPSIPSIQIELGQTYESPSEKEPCQPLNYNYHYILPSSQLQSVKAILIEAVGYSSSVEMEVYKVARSLSAVTSVMNPTQTPIGSCNAVDCRIIVACEFDPSVDYFIEVNAVQLSLTVTSLDSVTPIELVSEPSYNTLTYNNTDPTKNKWLTFSFNTTSPPHPLASVELFYTGDTAPWIIVTTTTTSSNILTTETSCSLHEAIGSVSETSYDVLPCFFTAGTPIYANILRLVSPINCQSDAFRINGRWQDFNASPNGNELPLLSHIYDPGNMTVLPNEPVYIKFSFPTAAEPEALLLVKGFDTSQISYSLIKGNLVPGAVLNPSCTSRCDTSSPNSLPNGGITNWLTGFSGATPRVLLDVYDVCFHCGDSYNTFYLKLTGSTTVTATPVVEKLLPTTLSTTSVSVSIGEVTAPGLAYFVLDPIDTTKGQFIEITVTSGFVLGVLYPYTTCPIWNSEPNLVRYKWCYENETCRIIMVEPNNFPLGISYNPYYLRLYGSAVFSVALRYSNSEACVEISSSATYCNGFTYSSSVLVFDNQIQPHDNYSSNLASIIQSSVSDYAILTTECIDSIHHFACGKGFVGCDGNGLVEYMPASLCTNVENDCGITMSEIGYPQYACGSLNYQGNENFIDLSINGALSLSPYNTFLLTLLLLTIILLH